jgi:hypothetical protein
MSEQAVAPHPAVGQLAALHHMRTYVDIGVVVVVQSGELAHGGMRGHRLLRHCKPVYRRLHPFSLSVS